MRVEMSPADLEQRLLAASSHDEWAALLAKFFAAHDLAFGHGTDNASDEAYWLLRHLQRWRDDVWAAAPEPALSRGVLDLAVRRVAERKPLAYLLGEAWFAGLPFNVDERVLVPRSPFAEIIERGFAPWCGLSPGDHVLDVGTGSGCLAVATAVHWPQLRVDATDVSEAALAVAGENVIRHGVGDRVRLLHADLFPPNRERYRVIMANPPYVPDSEMAALPAEYRAEPAVALAGGSNGFAVVERVLEAAVGRLVDGGVLFLEVGGGAARFTATHPRLQSTWVTFDRGGDGICAIRRADLESWLQSR